MNEQPVERAGAEERDDVAERLEKAGHEPEAGEVVDETKTPVEKWKERRVLQDKQRLARAEIDALKRVAEQINATAQLAVTALQAVALREIGLTRINANGASLLIVTCEPGRELRDDVAEQLIALLKLPLVVFPKDMVLEAVEGDRLVELTKQLEAAGWTRKQKLEIAHA